MKKLFRLQKDYHDALTADPEFEANEYRPYFILKNLEYKGKRINVGIPLRSNINLHFSKNSNEYIATTPTDHTIVKKGNIAGWHITKMVPVSFDKVVGFDISKYPSLNAALIIANDIYKEDMINKVKLLLKRLEAGEKVFGTIDFDKFIEKEEGK